MKRASGLRRGLLARFPMARLTALNWILAFCFPLSLFAQIDPCDLTWRRIATPNSPGQLVGQGSAYDSRRNIAVLFGGNNPLASIPSTDETWELTGSTWLKRNPPNRPHMRKDSAMAYDSNRGVCVLFGGGTNSFANEIPFNDTWEWDGTTWTQRVPDDPSAANRPPPLDYPVMVYDSFRKRIVLIGNTERVGNEVRPANTTWEWDGNIWIAHTGQPTPLPRAETAMAYDSARRVTVLFGGAGGQPRGDTWTWDGATWKLVATTGAVARAQHAMAFDERRKVVVMFSGGTDLNGTTITPFVDTSEWDGNSWTRKQFAQFGLDLKPRRFHKMWYDSREQRVMVFGGIFSVVFTHTILDDLWEARPPGRWVDFLYPGAPSSAETGEFYEPFNTLIEAVNAAPPGCKLILKPGARAETLTIGKPLTIEAYNGLVTIGR